MADAPLSTNIEYFNDPDKGQPIALGDVYIGQPDTDPEVLGNRVSVTLIQEDGTRVVKAPASQPFTTGAGGNILDNGSAVVILVDGTYSLKVLNSLGVQKIYVPFANEVAEDTASEGVLILNGSFENETQFTGLPDNWTIVEGTNGTVAIDDTDQVHGLKSLKFTSVDATGGGTATSDIFNVLESSDLSIRFSYVSSAVDTLNKVEIKYYDASGSVVTTNTVLSEGAANPTAWASYIILDIVPATAVQAELILTGMDGAGTTVIGSTNFDDIQVDQNGSSVLVLDSDNTEVEVVNTIVETDIFNFTIPAGTCEAGGTLRLTIVGDYLNNSGVNRAFGIGIALGAQTIKNSAGAFATFATSADRRNFKLIIDIPIISLSAQSALVSAVLSDDIAENQWAAISSGTNGQEKWLRKTGMTDDLTTDSDIVVSIEHTFAASTISFIKRGAVLEYLP